MRALTLPALFQERAQAHPERLALRLYTEDGLATWSYAHLLYKAQRAAGSLYEQGIRPGDRVLLLTTEVDDSVRAFLGAWMLGAIPSAIGLPFSLQDFDSYSARIREVARRIEAKALILGSGLTGVFSRENNDDLPIINAETLVVGERFHSPEAFEEKNQENDAILQLSSGTTGKPKVVRISHRAVLSNLGQMQRAFDITAQDSGVTWLPMYHDMGLIGGFLLPLYSGACGMSMMSVLAFRNNPLRWLQIISEVKATTSAAPTSAYAICARLAHRAKSLSLDLSSWRRALVGAEPVLPSVLEAFSRAYATYGFSSRAPMAVYGLAEASLAVTSPIPDQGPYVERVQRTSLEQEKRAILTTNDDEISRSFVSVGYVLDETSVQIRHGELVLPEREIGEVFVRGTSLFSGYLGDEERTAARFKDGWFSTGDLGYLAGGQLFITGRALDFIIRGGKNVDPIELEDVASQVQGVRGGGALACGIMREELSTESIVVVVESNIPDTEHVELLISVKRALQKNGHDVDEVKVVPVGWIPKTTSGKKMRQEAKVRLLADTYAGGNSRT